MLVPEILGRLRVAFFLQAKLVQDAEPFPPPLVRFGPDGVIADFLKNCFRGWHVSSHHYVASSLKSSYTPLHRPPPQALPVQLEKLRRLQASRNCALSNDGPFISVP